MEKNNEIIDIKKPVVNEPIIFQVIDWIQYQEEEKNDDGENESDELEKELELVPTNNHYFQNDTCYGTDLNKVCFKINSSNN